MHPYDSIALSQVVSQRRDGALALDAATRRHQAAAAPLMPLTRTSGSWSERMRAWLGRPRRGAADLRRGEADPCTDGTNGASRGVDRTRHVGA